MHLRPLAASSSDCDTVIARGRLTIEHSAISTLLLDNPGSGRQPSRPHRSVHEPASAGVTDLSVRLLPIGNGRDELVASKQRTKEALLVRFSVIMHSCCRNGSGTNG